jgi:hypothetical protein
MPAKVFGAILIGLAVVERAWPGWNGFVFEPAQITAGEVRIICAIYIVGGFILLCMPTKEG